VLKSIPSSSPPSRDIEIEIVFPISKELSAASNSAAVMAVTMRSQTIEDLLRSMASHHEQYIRDFESIQIALRSLHRERRDSRVSDMPATPSLRPIASPPIGVAAEAIFTPPTNSSHRSTPGAPAPIYSRNTPRSLHSNSDSEVLRSEEIGIMPLPLLDLQDMLLDHNREGRRGTIRGPRGVLDTASYSDSELVNYLRAIDFTGPVRAILQDLVKLVHEADETTTFGMLADHERGGYISTTYGVYDIDQRSLARKAIPGTLEEDSETRYHSALEEQIVTATTVWDTIKNINLNGDILGRIT
jgi:hypothetical protein